jgi:hypothetical protein
MVVWLCVTTTTMNQGVFNMSECKCNNPDCTGETCLCIELNQCDCDCYEKDTDTD